MKKGEKKKVKSNKRGISLITLVITIIIMIIIAGAIILTLSNSRIFDNANDAVGAYDLKQAQTIADLAWAEAYADGARTKSELEGPVKQALVDNGLGNKYEAKVTEEGVTVKEKEQRNR